MAVRNDAAMIRRQNGSWRSLAQAHAVNVRAAASPCPVLKTKTHGRRDEPTPQGTRLLRACWLRFTLKRRAPHNKSALTRNQGTWNSHARFSPCHGFKMIVEPLSPIKTRFLGFLSKRLHKKNHRPTQAASRSTICAMALCPAARLKY